MDPLTIASIAAPFLLQAFSPGQKEEVQRYSPFRGKQEQLFSQLQQALQGQGAGGAFGESADYYRRLLSGDEAGAFEAPLRREFQEDILPGIAEQFAGMGSGALSSSGFQQASTRAGTDLAERLGSLRANLRMQGAQGLSGLAQQGLSTVDEMVFRPRTPGLGEQFATSIAGGVGQGLGQIGASYLGGKLPFLNK